MNRLSNLYGLFQLGSDLRGIYDKLDDQHTIADIRLPILQMVKSLTEMSAGKIIPLDATKEAILKLVDISKEMVKDAYLNWNQPLNTYYTSQVKDAITTLQFALSEELRQLPTYIVTEKGYLSIDKLIDGASKGYSALIKETVDDFIRYEIDEAGRCLVFGLFTACGFHILRSVEVAIKGYLHAVKGNLPKQSQRNWGEYIKQLEDSKASPELIDCLRILKTKRNPLMHPQDKLEEGEAISLFSMCNSTMDELIKDVFNKSLEIRFKDALEILSNL